MMIQTEIADHQINPLKRLRQSRDWNQAEMAEAFSRFTRRTVTQGDISAFESGKRLGVRRARLLAEFFGVSLNEVLGIENIA